MGRGVCCPVVGRVRGRFISKTNNTAFLYIDAFSTGTFYALSQSLISTALPRQDKAVSGLSCIPGKPLHLW